MQVKKLLSKIALSCVVTAIILFSNEAFAQVKIGSNPNAINTANNLEIEANNGNKVVVTKEDGGRVGINNAAPAARLHVGGDVIIGNAPTASGPGHSTLVRENATGKIKVLPVADTGYPITYVTYNINNVDGDDLDNFNTLIPSSAYTVIIVGVVFDGPDLASTPRGNYSPLNFEAVRGNGGTWRLKADYDRGSVIIDENGNWRIRCLIISNSMVRMLDPIEKDLDGSSTGQADALPQGL